MDNKSGRKQSYFHKFDELCYVMEVSDIVMVHE